MFRSVLVWFCCVAMLVAGTPSYGLVWCRTDDGTVALELATTDGRCDHVMASIESLADAASTSVQRAADQCDDEMVGAVALSATPERVNAPANALVFLSQLVFSLTGHRTQELAASHRPSAAATAPIPDDVSFVRETVVILV